LRKEKESMFNTIKTIDIHELEEEVIKRIGENEYTEELDRYLFDEVANDSYNSITIATLKDEIADINDGYNNYFIGEENEYILTLNTIIEIFEEAGIKEEEKVLVSVSW
jgi:phenylalanyl-tRNA synthetase alpha subunit